MIAGPNALADWALTTLFPLCRDHFVDRVHGGFHEQLDPAGTPMPVGFKRLMVQCRQLYVHSQAALLGDLSGTQAADAGYAFLRRTYHDTNHGGWFFSASNTGEPANRRKDLYGHAFVLFALAYLHRAFAAPDAIALAHQTMDVLRTRLRAPNGGYWDAADQDWTPHRTLRRQNPHMHLLEGVLALFEATGETRWLSEADDLIALFHDHLFDTSMLGEFFAHDWSPDATHGHIVEPGHHFEWAWLLHRHAELTGQPAPPAADTLFAIALRHGFDTQHGGLRDQHDRQGEPILHTRRIWGMAEAIKAAAIRNEPAKVTSLIHQLTEIFIEPARVGWIEAVDQDGTAIRTDLPGSTPYHLFLAAAEVRRLSEK